MWAPGHHRAGSPSLVLPWPSQETQVELSQIKPEETGQGFTSTREAALTGQLDTNELMRQEPALGGGVAMGGAGGGWKVRQL